MYKLHYKDSHVLYCPAWGWALPGQMWSHFDTATVRFAVCSEVADIWSKMSHLLLTVVTCVASLLSKTLQHCTVFLSVSHPTPVLQCAARALASAGVLASVGMDTQADQHVGCRQGVSLPLLSSGEQQLHSTLYTEWFQWLC